VGAVAVFGVGGGDVDVPSPLEGVQFGGPEVGGVVGVGGWEPVGFDESRTFLFSIVEARGWDGIATYQTGPFLNFPSSKKSVRLSASHSGTRSPAVKVK
jgi:hypothetical protein